MSSTLYKIILGILLSIGLASCKDDYLPKPKTYLRLDIAPHSYRTLDTNLPFTLRYADNAFLSYPYKEQPYWLNINYPKLNASIYLSYFKVDTNLPQLLNDAQSMAYRHISKANEIKQELVILPATKVYGLIYLIEGVETASPINFYVTDSSNHYLRGAVYFNFAPNNDSIAPYIKGIREDIDTLIKTLYWK